MKRTSKIILILLLALLVIAAMTVAACKPNDPQGGTDGSDSPGDGGQGGGGQGDDPTHQHTFAEQWSVSDAEHWHAATCNHDVTADNAAHTLVNNVCSVCGYQNNVDWNDFTFEPDGDGYVLTKYNGTAAHVNIPDVYNDLPVVSIGEDAFSECESLVSVTIPDCVMIIERGAFVGCLGLTSIVIPSGVTSIGSYAFVGCYYLVIYCEAPEQPSGWYRGWNQCQQYPDNYCPIVWNCQQNDVADDGYTYGIVDGIHYGFKDSQAKVYRNNYSGDIVIPSTVNYQGKDFVVTSIGDYAFDGCNSLTSITIPDGVTSIGYFAFAGSWNLASITIPITVKSIGGWAFDCDGSSSSVLQNVYYSGSIADWCEIDFNDYYSNPMSGAEAQNFYIKEGGDWQEVTEIEIPDGITEIGSWQFDGFDHLTSVTIHDGVTSIGEATFNSCENLVLVNIGANSKLENIGRYAFSGCSSITSITIPDGVTSIGDEAFRDCSSLTSIAIPDGVTSIGDSAFFGCNSLTSITIPDGVTSIGSWAFGDCRSLTSIFIPKSVTNMGEMVFGVCSNLTIYCEATTKPSGWESDWNYLGSYDWTDCYCSVVWGATREDVEGR